MNEADRQKAWKHFFMMMIEAVVRQQGRDALGVKLARRCMPDHDFCTTALDANLVGIGGIGAEKGYCDRDDGPSRSEQTTIKDGLHEASERQAGLQGI
jgi:hypothetical protein